MELHHTLSDFFQETVHSALRNQGVDASDHAEAYLVGLLADYARPRTPLDAEPLALRLAQAAFAAPAERARILRELGDRSLYVSGFFADSLARRAVDVGYYIEVGGTAYRQLARMPREPGEVYLELARQFPRFVEVLAEVSEWSAVCSDAGVVQLYERWRRTGAEWIARRLRAKGVIPGGDVQ